MNAIRASTLIGVFSFCSPSRGPTSTMRTWSLMAFSRWGGLDFGQFDAFLHDIADLALQALQHTRERRTQGLLHLHHFEGQDCRTLLQRSALLRQQCDHGTRQGRHDPVLTDLFFVVTAERIDPMQVETPVAGPDIQFMAFDDGDDMRSRTVQREIETAVFTARMREAEFPVAALPRCGTPPIMHPPRVLGGPVPP